MILFIECIIFSILFSFMIFIPLYKNPLGQIMSYPVEIRKRVESLPQYKDCIKAKEKKHLSIKILSIFVFALILCVVAYLSGAKTVTEVFKHVFILFFFVNIYDLFIMDLLIFRNVKKFRIPGTEDMDKEYKNPRHHIIGAFIGTILGIIVATLSAGYLQLFKIIFG